MRLENHYCCRCHKTTKHRVEGATFQCTGCGVVVEKEQPREQRSLIGDPFRSYKTS